MLSPLISLPLLVYFIIARTVYRHLMLKAEDKRPDTGGLHWVQALNQLWYCLVMFSIMMGYILWVRGRVEQAILAYSGVFIALRHWSFYRGLEWRFLPLEKIVELDMATEQGLFEWGP